MKVVPKGKTALFRTCDTRQLKQKEGKERKGREERKEKKDRGKRGGGGAATLVSRSQRVTNGVTVGLNISLHHAKGEGRGGRRRKRRKRKSDDSGPINDFGTV